MRSDAQVPVYLWGVEVRPQRTTDVGELRLQPGASVAGWIKTDRDELPSAECRAELVAETSGAPGNLQVEERLRRTAQEARPNERGFFQLSGVAPGRYTLKVSQPGFAPRSVPGIEVREGLEAQVLEPVVLARPVTFELALDPGVEPYGQPWRVRLVRRSVPTDPPGETFQARASPEGTCSITNVPAGTYELSVLGDDNSIWHSEFLEVAAGRLPHMVQIPAVRIEGLVTRGGDPLASTVWLGRGGRRLRFDSDGEGRFQGLLPEEGTWNASLTSVEEGWRISLATVEVKVPEGKNIARVEIVVPDTTLEGEVVDEAGRPVFAAQVSAFSSARIDSRVRTDRKGEFAIHGLPAGPVTLSATEQDRESGWVQSALAEGAGSPWLRLVVRRLRKARGRVLSPSGGLPGATVLAWPASQPASRVATAMSGPGGDFEMEVPEGESALQLLVLPPGFAFRIATVRLETERPFEIVVEPHGGTLILESPSPSAEPLLVHEGVFVPLQPLRDWARMQGAPSSEAGRLVVPNVAGGAYNLCRGRAEGSSAACSAGVLTPLGELVLRAPD
ncbi:MAG: carboxypeptidase regulatory-like domain-containing protein [Thermoanaerobaculia bacterium]